MPKRSAARSAPGMGGMLDGDVKSDGSAFAVPEFAYNATINDRMSWGVSVYGTGGMNTEYPGASVTCSPDQGVTTYQGNLLCGQGKLGVDLMQLIVAPTFAYKLNERHSLGVSPLLVMQQFKATGLQAFASTDPASQMSSSPGNVTNKGADRSTGMGVRLGYLGQVHLISRKTMRWASTCKSRLPCPWSQIIRESITAASLQLAIL